MRVAWSVLIGDRVEATDLGAGDLDTRSDRHDQNRRCRSTARPVVAGWPWWWRSALLEADGSNRQRGRHRREADEHADDQAKRTASGRTKCGTLRQSPSQGTGKCINVSVGPPIDCSRRANSSIGTWLSLSGSCPASSSERTPGGLRVAGRW